ncbi:hypothetical protein [Methylobacterium sp. A54F]
MCNACGFYCCGSDEFEGCGCDGFPEPACWEPDCDDVDFGDGMDVDDDDDGGVLMPLAACRCALPSRFSCEEVA